jgi:hypothetical protein
MPVSAVENWSEIEGSVAEIAPSPELAEYMVMTVDVTRVTPVHGYPNLFSWAVGEKVAVNVAASRVAEIGLVPGDLIRCRIRKAGPTATFADPESLAKT